MRRNAPPPPQYRSYPQKRQQRFMPATTQVCEFCQRWLTAKTLLR
jgi:hypothetical protein